MSGGLITAGILGGFFALIFVGGSVLIWMALITGDTLTPAQSTVINLADWVVKFCLGALAGYISGAKLMQGKAKGAASG